MEKITNYKELSAGQLIQQFRESLTNRSFQADLAPFAMASQDLEELFFNLLNNLSIDTASGKTLDNIGAMVGIARTGAQDDTSYRLDIYFKILQNTGFGAPEELIQTCMKALDPDSVILEEPGNATVHLTLTNPRKLYSSTDVSDTVNGNLYAILRKGVAAGVMLDLSIDGAKAPFIWEVEGNDTIFPFGGGWEDDPVLAGYWDN